MRSLLFTSVALFVVACSSSDGSDPPAEQIGDPTSPSKTTENAPLPPPSGANSGSKLVPSSHHDPSAKDAGTDAPATTPPDPANDPGPKPKGSCSITKDSSGFFTRSSPTGASYVGYVPASYDGTSAALLVVGLHGCGDSAYNFATWGVNPYDTRATQQHIGISVDGASGSGGCWSKGADDGKVFAAIADIASCFWVHQHKVVLAGFSSGGELAYRVAFMNASKFAGLLIESSAIYAASNDESSLISGATWKLPIAHRQHSGDTVFPLADVQSDWANLKAAGFPLQTDVTSGGHDGTSTDWASWLLPRATGWLSPM